MEPLFQRFIKIFIFIEIFRRQASLLYTSVPKRQSKRKAEKWKTLR